jgi:pimeloyl-ACP methyl ester carboxylesterase
MADTPETATPEKSLAIFVHGINADETSFDPLFALMEQDPVMKAAFDWKAFPYDSKPFHGFLDPLYRIPDFHDITQHLDQYIASLFTPEYHQLFLIGHSQGGLIIQAWLEKVLCGDRGDSLKSLREVVFLCTPTLGSTLASPLRRVIFSIIHDPQEADLRVFNTQVAEARRYVEEHVDQAYTRDASHCPIPIVSFWGGEDNVVTSASAQASFGNTLEIEGHHSSVLQPESTDDDRYKIITSTLLRPWGHRHIFEIDRYETVIAVSPLANPQYTAVINGQTETRVADNVATITRTVSFSAKNLCTDLFHFNYQTGPEGYLKPRFDMLNRDPDEAPPPNQAATDESGRWEKGGTDTTYDFRPAAGRTYAHTVEVWKGFDAGSRDVHFHLGSALRCGMYVFAVDLSAYVAAGWTVSQPPQLYRDPSVTLEHDIREHREPQNMVAGGISDSVGRWTWTFPDFRGGIVDAVWDVTAPKS